MVKQHYTLQISDGDTSVRTGGLSDIVLHIDADISVSVRAVLQLALYLPCDAALHSRPRILASCGRHYCGCACAEVNTYLTEIIMSIHNTNCRHSIFSRDCRKILFKLNR